MKKLFLTGAAGDIGIAVKQKFQQYNYFITAPTRQELDLASSAGISAYFGDNAKEYDAFVYCAGINDPELIENLPIERVQETLQVNLLAFYAILQYLIPFFKEKGGHIVAISSLYGTIARSGRAAYVMSKHALNGLVQAAAIELGKYGVKINTVSPGFVDTKMTRKNNDPEKIESLESKIALGSLSRPSDIADIVYYLCSDQNNYITGQDIVIDGGFMAGSFQ